MVPAALRRWFVIHCFVDLAFAVPLAVAPHWMLTWLGWTAVDPLATRLVAAALFGIGIQSWLGRDEDVATFRAMLNLKIIWSGTAVLGAAASMLEGGPVLGWGVVGVFAVFFAIWGRYRLALRA